VRWKDKGVRVRCLLTANGDIHVNRRYYWLSTDRHECPADASLGVDGHGVSARAREACCRFSMLASFADAVKELNRYAGIPISAEFLRQIVEREGERIARAREDGSLPCAMDSNQTEPERRLYASLDGVFARMVREQEKRSRREKAEKRRAELPPKRRAALPPLPPMRPGHTEGFREMKLGVFYTQDRKRRHSFVTCGDHEQAGRLVKTHARRVKFSAAAERVAITDGAVWIEAQLRQNLPELDMLLLDFFHLSQHVHQAAQTCLGENDEAADWAKARLEELKRTGPLVPLATMRALLAKLKSKPRREAMQELIGYMEKRLSMLQYPEAIRRGWDIGSGPMEAQCKTHIHRVKLAGAKWDQNHAQSMMNLVALHSSNQWTTYWKQRRAA
jgi:hypothetical protein